MQTSLIYMLLSLHSTITEANLTADRLGLPHARISDLAQIQDFPFLWPRDEVNNIYWGLSAAVCTTNFNFAFQEQGELAGIGVIQLHGPAGMEDWRDNDHKLGVPRGSVTKEMAYNQARGWLERMGVDVAAMEKRHPSHVEHLRFPTVSSAFIVTWVGAAEKGKKNRPGAEVCLNASSNWLVRLKVNDFRFYRNPLPHIPHAIAINLLPDEPVRRFFGVGPKDRPQRIFTQYGLRYTNAFELLETPPPYEAAGRRALLAEAKQMLSILECDQLDEPNEQNLTDIYVNPPAFGSGGRLEFRNGEIQYDTDGKLRLFRFLPRGQTNYYLWQAQAQTRISNEEAYQIATQKLAALSVDVNLLDREYKRTFNRGQFRKYDAKKRWVWFQSPEYWLVWRNRTNEFKPAALRLAVYGDIKQVGQIELQDPACWKRPPATVTNRLDWIRGR